MGPPSVKGLLQQPSSIYEQASPSSAHYSTHSSSSSVLQTLHLSVPSLQSASSQAQLVVLVVQLRSERLWPSGKCLRCEDRDARTQIELNSPILQHISPTCFKVVVATCFSLNKTIVHPDTLEIPRTFLPAVYIFVCERQTC